MVKRLIISCNPDEINEQKIEDIRKQFETEDVIFLDGMFSYGVVEYDEFAIARRKNKK